MSASNESAQDPEIEDLSAETIMAVADRLEASASFTDLVSRECELDALWTLCDVALDYAASDTGDGVGGLGELTGADRMNLEEVRSLIGQVIGLVGSSQLAKAAAMLRQAAALAASLP